MADELNLNQAGTLPPELFAQQQALNRQQQMAAMLMQQNQQPQGQMISGRYVAPAWTQMLQPVANMLTGAYLAKQGDTQASKLAEQLRAGRETERQAALQAIQQGKPIEALSLPNVYGGVTPFQGALVKAAIPETPTEVRKFEYAQKNPEFAQYEVGLKRAGAPSVSVTMDKGLAAQVGPMMKESKEKTIGAVKEIDAANQVIGAIDSNKMFTGPLANQRLSAAQIGSTLGVGGKDVTEKINNTRQAIQGLAEITLQGRQEMRGQGAITESEGKLAERAKSGDISLTPGELRQLAGAAKRAGEYTYNQHQTQLQAMSQNPETRQLIPYYNVGMMPQREMPQAPAQPNANQQLNIPAAGGWSVKSVK